ncbi:MAG: hypothetical protein SAJ12_20330 [Jaaginema sp. PMC 1079.18]|nr:hypothetical protein [Jaaginema sp. PMC 1079.18]MEC4868645.1 hypothetical protein [Jaaginema sp. PMC 1078.18]
MVIGVFAGGGEAEVEGLIKFLKRNFPQKNFERYLPIRKKKPKPNKQTRGYGHTNESLIVQIQETLIQAIDNNPNFCESILILDDLDCRNVQTQRSNFLQSIANIDECREIDVFVGFASPEIEAWIVADWDNSIARHPDFRRRHNRMRHWLSTQRNVNFRKPESFSEYDPQKDCCSEKLSKALIESTQFLEDRKKNFPIYSKGSHTPDLLLMVEAEIIQQRCPEFRQMYNHLNRE